MDFVDLVELVWAGRLKIAVATVAMCSVAVAANFLMAPTYKATELIEVSVPNQHLGGLSSLAKSLGGVASLAGASLGLESNNARSVALATLKSRYIIERFIDQHQLLPVLFPSRWDRGANRWSVTGSKIPNDQDGYKLFVKKIFSVSDDGTTGLVRVVVKWKNPNEAAGWLEGVVAAANERLRNREVMRYRANIKYLDTTAQDVKVLTVQQTLYSLMAEEYQKLMVAENPEDATLQVVDPVVVPLRPEPKLLLLLGLGASGGFVAGLLYVIFSNAIAGRRKEGAWRGVSDRYVVERARMEKPDLGSGDS